MSKIILKISGEALKDDNNLISNKKLDIVLDTIELLKSHNHKVAIVVGGGNIFRGRENTEMDEVTRDTIGMMGTVINALYIKDYLVKHDLNVTISTPFDFPNLIENYTDEELEEKYESGDVIIFGGGVGMSGYSTDSGVVLASSKINANIIIKMTNVDGVYDSDPKVNKKAKKYDKLTYEEVIEQNLGVMDKYAIKKCMEKGIVIVVMNFNNYKHILDRDNGTIIGG